MTLFAKLLTELDKFHTDEPLVIESLLEQRLKDYLRKKFVVESQVIDGKDRYDLLVTDRNEIVCLELKIKADVSDVEQFDRYMHKWKDGLIVVCWQASFSLRDIFFIVKKQSPVKIELVELAKRYQFA